MGARTGLLGVCSAHRKFAFVPTQKSVYCIVVPMAPSHRRILGKGSWPDLAQCNLRRPGALLTVQAGGMPLSRASVSETRCAATSHSWQLCWLFTLMLAHPSRAELIPGHAVQAASRAQPP